MSLQQTIPSGRSEQRTIPWQRVLALSASFSYDTFGRMTSDGLAGTSISYNHLDLPSKIASNGTNEVNYCNLADGNKTGA